MHAYLTKARQCLASASINLDSGLSNDAGRNAYLAVFHASQAYIFSRTGKTAKTHQGVQSEMHRLARDEPRLDKDLLSFLSHAYNLKAVADYETGPDSDIPADRSLKAIQTAANFIDCISKILNDS